MTRALTTEETERIEEKLEELIVTAKGIGDHEIDRKLADFICAEFGLPRDRAEATAKAYGDSWVHSAVAVCATTFRLQLAELYPNEPIPPLWCFEILECDRHDEKPLDDESGLALAQAVRLLRLWLQDHAKRP